MLISIACLSTLDRDDSHFTGCWLKNGQAGTTTTKAVISESTETYSETRIFCVTNPESTVRMAPTVVI